MTSSADEKESQLYFEKAVNAHDSGDDRLCVVLLKHLRPFTKPAQHRLLTAALFNLWVRSRSSKSEQEFSEKAVIQAFSDYFRDVDDISVNEYIKLSQIYICQGALEGALKILGLASARGYLTDTAIILQSWTIIKRVGSPIEAEKYIVYLCSAVMMEDRGNIIDGEIILPTCGFKLKILYLFCALQNARRVKSGKSKKEKEEAMKSFNALLTEAYVLYFKQFKTSRVAIEWFNSPVLWMNIGDELLKTPFILLAEDAFWECYLRESLAEPPLSKVLHSMKLTRRMDSANGFIEKAYNKNPWNLLCRAFLLKVGGHWPETFATHAYLLSKIQGCVRGWRLRKHFEAVRQIALEKLAVFQAKMDRASKKYSKIQFQKLHSYLHLWRANSRYLMLLKKRSATVIQSIGRRHMAMVSYDIAQRRVWRANSNFVLTLELIRDIRRAQALGRWRGAYLTSLKHRSADCLANIITINGNSKKFLKAIEMLMIILSRRKFFNNKLVYRHWRAKYIRMTTARARTSIRFQIRNLFRKQEEMQLEAELQLTVARLNKIQTQSSFVPSSLSTMHKFWALWKSTYVEVKSARLTRENVDKFCKNMRRIYARRLDRELVRHRRAMKEREKSVAIRAAFKLCKQPFRFWFVLMMTLRLQRAIRVFLAKSKTEKKLHVVNYIRNKNASRRLKMLKKTMFLIGKYMYLTYRERWRASKLITKAIRMWNFKKRIKLNLKRKMNALKFCNTLDFVSKSLLFRVVAWRIDYVNMSRKLSSVFSSLYKRVCQAGFRAIYTAAMAQKLRERQLRELVRIFVLDKLESLFWRGVHQSVRIDKTIGSKSEDGMYFVWECPIPTTLVRFDDFNRIALTKSFKTFVALFRSRARSRREAIKSYSVKVYKTQLLLTMQTRFEKRVLLVAAIRRFLCELRVEAIRYRARRLAEQAERVVQANKKAAFCKVKLFCDRRLLAAARLQRCARTALAVMRVSKRRGANLKCELSESLVYKRVRQRYMLDSIKIWLLAYSDIITSAATGQFYLNEILQSAPDKFNSSTGGLFPLKSSMRKLQLSLSKTSYQSPIPKNKNTEFQSTEFYHHLFKIRKSGIFLFDGLNQDITDIEVIYCAKSSDAICCSFITDSQAANLLQHYSGRKFVACGGLFATLGMSALIGHLARSTLREGNSLHLSDLKIPLPEVQMFLGLFSVGYLSQLRELSIDCKSFGVIGVMSLLRSISNNSTLERFFADFSGCTSSFGVLSHPLSELSANTTLQELHLTGEPLAAACVLGLARSCADGLASLRYLKLATNDVVSAKWLVEVCKNRSRSGKGVSVFVDNSPIAS